MSIFMHEYFIVSTGLQILANNYTAQRHALACAIVGIVIIDQRCPVEELNIAHPAGCISLCPIAEPKPCCIPS